MRVGPSPNIKAMPAAGRIFHCWSAKNGSCREVGKAWLQHICHEVIIGFIVTVFALPPQIFMGHQRLQWRAEMLVCACRPLVYYVQTAWNDIADGNADGNIIKHNEFL